MKICWDNLEDFHLTRNGVLERRNTYYIEKPSCKKCGDPYLTVKSKQSNFCSHSCVMSDKNHPMYGKHHTIEAKKRISEYGKSRMGILNHNYKGDEAGFAIYNTYKDKLESYEDVREQEDTKLLEVKCIYCGQWFVPTRMAADSRLRAINNLNMGEQRLYCSENCKQACPTYGMRKYPKGFKHASSREVDPYLRKMVLERDNWTCQICGKTSKEAQLHCHHMDPVAQNPMFQNDMDSCIILCKCCHKMVHKQHGCRYIDLRCKRETGHVENLDKIILRLKEQKRRS